MRTTLTIDPEIAARLEQEVALGKRSQEKTKLSRLESWRWFATAMPSWLDARGVGV